MVGLQALADVGEVGTANAAVPGNRMAIFAALVVEELRAGGHRTAGRPMTSPAYRQIRAVFTARTVTVDQAYGDDIAGAALAAAGSLLRIAGFDSSRVLELRLLPS